MTDADLDSLKLMSIEDLERFAENLKIAIASTGHSRDWDIRKKAIDEEWLRHAEAEIFERSLGLKDTE